MPPNRRAVITQKIERETTGLAGALFAHVEHDAGWITGIRFSHKWKDGGGLDRALAALGDALTSIARDIQGEGA